MKSLLKPAPKLKTPAESKRRIYSFLRQSPIGVLSSVDPDGNPHAAVIYFSIDKKLNAYFITKRETKKHDNLKHNNRVMLVSYEAFSQTTAQMTGFAEPITSPVEVAQVFIDTLKASRSSSESGIPPISKLNAGEYVAYRIKPVQIRMTLFIRPDHGGYEMYETIDFET